MMPSDEKYKLFQKERTIRQIVVIDQTIREGMQYRGMMFSEEERLKLLEYQEALGVDISQSAYPSAHDSEKEMLKSLHEEAVERGYGIRVAGLGRALIKDADLIMESGVKDIQLHLAMNKENSDSGYRRLKEVVSFIRGRLQQAVIEINILDLGKIDPDFLIRSAKIIINELRIDILTLPDTSGILSPNFLSHRISLVAGLAEGSSTLLGVHCHNDMGMATANTITGVEAGASVVEVSALGIGERNGIGDLFIVGKLLKEQGYSLNLKTENIEMFRNYYEYIDDLCFKKTGIHLLNYNTPFFGDSVHTHVAGTHGMTPFGNKDKEDFFLNVLCGKHLVKKYLEKNDIAFDENRLPEIVSKIKNFSVKKKRCITRAEVGDLLSGRTG
jgi:isopropylmalate/homocitrate/citramalate synthase